MSRGSLSAKVAIITGGGKGIGARTAERLAQEDAELVLVGRDFDALQTHAKLLDTKYNGRSTLAVACDVTKEPEVAGMISETIERFGRLDILVNAAGGTGPVETPAADYPAEEFMNILVVNVLGTFLPCKYAIPHLKQHGGRIINIAGTSGLRGYPNRSGYSASKWAVRGLTRTLALELGPYDVTVNDICPNVTNGSRMDRIVHLKAERSGMTPAEVYEDFAAQTALGRFVEEDDIAAAITFLVSEAARNITGHDIPVDAGWDV